LQVTTKTRLVNLILSVNKMNKKLLFIIAILIATNSNAQIIFEKGYFINNSNQKTACFIKNIDWVNNPTEFEYTLTKDSEKRSATIKSIKEFGVSNSSKYARAKVNIDRSSEVLNNLSVDKNPLLEEEVLFLKVLVEGKSNLYEYSETNFKRYFYSKENTPIEQLIFKSYKTAENKIGTNNRFKQQLWNDLKCPTFSMNKLKKLVYRKKELINFFVAHNACNNKEYINFEEKQKKDLFNLNFRPGLNYSSLSTQNYYSNSKNIAFDNEWTFRVGIEAEFIMPFNKNKWAFVIEPTVQYFNSKKEVDSKNAKADYKSIELPLGVRHYFFLKEHSKLFINGAFILDFSSNSIIESYSGSKLEIKSRNSFALGIGYKYQDSYSLEIRSITKRDLLSDYMSYSAAYSSLSIIFGYSFF